MGSLTGLRILYDHRVLLSGVKCSLAQRINSVLEEIDPFFIQCFRFFHNGTKIRKLEINDWFIDTFGLSPFSRTKCSLAKNQALFPHPKLLETFF